MRIHLYVEGGGDGEKLRTACRKGFSEFLSKAGLAGRMPRITACGSRREAYEDFCTAFGQAGPDDFPVLLVDSEGPVSADHGPWDHLRHRPDDAWERPEDASDDQAHLMVQCMEAWFVADRTALERYFGKGFSKAPLPGRRNVEEIAKKDLEKALETATSHSQTKGPYNKGKHSFALLAVLEPERVRAGAPHAARLIEVLLRMAG